MEQSAGGIKELNQTVKPNQNSLALFLWFQSGFFHKSVDKSREFLSYECELR